MTTTKARIAAYREQINNKWQTGIEQIILKYNKYLDYACLLKYVSLAFIEKYYYELELNNAASHISICNNINVTEDFVKRHTSQNLNLRLYMFRENKNISFAFWKEHYDKFVNSYNEHLYSYKDNLSTCLSQIASLTINDVLQNDWNWDYQELSKHPNIHVNDIIKHIHLFKSNYKLAVIYDKYCSNNYVYSNVYKNPTLQIQHILKLGTFHITSNIKKKISIHPNITESIVKQYINEPLWNWLSLMQNKNLSDGFILEYIYPHINFEALCSDFISNKFTGYEINNEIYNAFNTRQNIEFILHAPTYTHALLCKLDFYIYKYIKLYPDLPWPKEYILFYDTLNTHEFYKISLYYIELYKYRQYSGQYRTEYNNAIEFIIKYFDVANTDISKLNLFITDKSIFSIFFSSSVFDMLFLNSKFTLEHLLKNSKTLFFTLNKKCDVSQIFIDREYENFIAKHMRRYVAARQIQRAWATAIYDPQYALCHKIQYSRLESLLNN